MAFQSTATFPFSCPLFPFQNWKHIIRTFLPPKTIRNPPANISILFRHPKNTPDVEFLSQPLRLWQTYLHADEVDTRAGISFTNSIPASWSPNCFEPVNWVSRLHEDCSKQRYGKFAREKQILSTAQCKPPAAFTRHDLFKIWNPSAKSILC